MKKVSVYVLYDSVSLKIRYIGITETSLGLRLKGHLNDALYMRSNPHKCKWIRKMLAEESEICIRRIHVCTSRYEAEKLENELIEKYRDKHKLLNCLDLGKFVGKGKKSAQNLKSKKVYMYSLEGEFIEEFPSVKDTAKFLSLNPHTISRVLSGRKKSTRKNQFSLLKLDKMPNIFKNKKAPYLSD
jgi:hypothetical protein